MSAGKYDLIVVGTGFAGTFFLKKYLESAPETARVLVLEKGAKRDHKWHHDNLWRLGLSADAAYHNLTPEKKWMFSMAWGGSSNCWWACAPRMLPEDFEIKTRYGQGVDWPITYSDLEEYYCEAEEIMAISGPNENAVLFPRSRPFPQPPHLLSDPDKLLKKAYPELYFPMATGRARLTTPNGRPRCCASGVCTSCPIDSKFTVINEMAALFEDPRVTLLTDAAAETVETANGVATGVTYRQEGAEQSAQADFVALGANAFYNPYILLRSGIDHPLTGKGVCEQVGISVEIFLDGVDNFNGSTSKTGHGFNLYTGEHRRTGAACLFETANVPKLRDARGRWRQYMLVKLIFEELRQDQNMVRIDPSRPDKPAVEFHRHSDYAQAGIDQVRPMLDKMLEALPVENYRVSREIDPTESHIMCSVVMGKDPATSVVDENMLHHNVRNLAVLGCSAFPTAAPANPTLTLSAMCLRAADKLFGKTPV